MNDKKIVKLKIINGAFTKTIVIYESGVVKVNDIEYKKIDIVEEIKKYLDIVKQKGIRKSSIDNRCVIEYDNEKYNSGSVYSDIELMIRNNRSIESVNSELMNLRTKEKEKQKKLNNKLEIIAENKSKIIDIYKNRMQLDIEDLTDVSIKKFESIKFNLKKKKQFSIGESRVLSKYIDIPNDLEYPTELEFLAQINLNDISKYDKTDLLPKTGNLYFFQGPLIDGTYYECGKVIYSDNNNLIRKNVFVYNEDMLLELGIYNIKIKQDTYLEDNDSESKVFGIYSDPQLDENDILKVSNKYLVLLQLGWDIYGEGVITFLITKEDLINKNFSKVIYTYSQT